MPALALTGLAAGLIARVLHTPDRASRIWLVALLVTGAPVVWRTIRDALAGRFATDIVATLAISAAVLLHDPLPGLIVVLMQTGGEALERYAEGRASDAVRQLELLAPTIAHRQRDGVVVDVAVTVAEPGDELLVRPGELIPCDAVVLAGYSHVDTSHLTGEPLPVRATPGTHLASGMLNLEGALTLTVTAPARESRYAQIVALVRTAQASKAPLQRLADRYAVWFTPLTLGVCAATYLASGDAIRVLAVLVVATPCPLILAAPVAIVGGINRAARRGIIFRHGAALEQLAHVTVAVFDKTGTLTVGRPVVARVIAASGITENELLRFAAAIENKSGHLLARSIVEEAARRNVALADAQDIAELAGQGVTGSVDGHRVAVGSRPFVTALYPAAEADLAGLLPVHSGEGLRAAIAIDQRGAGIVEYADQVRPGLRLFIARLRALGVRRTMLLSGDSTDNARHAATEVGIEETRGDLLPGDKTAVVNGLMSRGERVLMVGDGTNDAPALSAATVGIALASGGGGIAAEAADAVVLADDPSRIAEAMAISQRTVGIATQSIWVGLALSGIAMGFAAAGHLPPTAGALLQEVIDVAVILNALRAARPVA